MARRKNSKKQKEDNNRRAIHSKLARWMWILTGIGLLLIALIFFLVSMQDIPSFEELENPDIDYASVVISEDEEELGRFYEENRVAVPYDSLNPRLINALISTEDVRYFSHTGIDFIAVGRVIFKTVLLGQRSSGGGSTITQQLAKQLFSARNFSGMNKIEKAFTLVNYKLKEWITALLLERSYTKEEIIAMYLNEYDFIYSSHGIEAASETYFGKEQDQLNTEEAATLIGMLKNSVLYNPVRFPQNAIQRRNVVMNQMRKAGHLTQTEYDSLSAKNIDMTSFHRSDHLSGDATYFRSYIAEWTKNLIRKNNITKSDGTLYNVYTDGLRIYTTIDSRMQKHLQSAVNEHMEVNQERFFEHWEGKNIWEYKYDNYPVDIKKQNLQKLIRRSDRYRRMQSSFLADDISNLQRGFNITLKDYDLERLVKSKNEEGYLEKLQQKNHISEEKADIYRGIIKSDYWQSFETDWNRLQERVDKVFNEPTEMTVFAYNDEMEKDTVMSPLDSIKYHRMILQAGSMAVNPKNGHVKAWVGGVDHKYFQYGHITARRQVGSTFKPFLYATAISLQGFSPCFPVMDIQYTIQPGEGDFGLLKPWTPQNAMDEYTQEKMVLYEALKKSKNTISTYLMKQLGDTKPLRGIVHNMGIDSSERLPNGRSVIPRQPSIALGAADLSVMEMTGAYTTFANNGKYTKPVFVTKIEDRNGKVLYQSVPKTQVALNSTVNYVMIKMLRYVASSYPNFYKLESDVGGKTGTTNDHTDGWFMGVSPNIVVGTWVGGEDRWMRFRNLTYGQGARMARPIYYKFMRSIEQDEELNYDASERFYRPPGELSIETDCDKYRRNNNSGREQQMFEDKKAEESGEESGDDGDGGFF